MVDTARNTLVFDNLTSQLQFPSFLAFAYISVIDFLERLEPVAFVIWLVCGFFKIAVCLYVAAVALAQTVKVREHRSFCLRWRCC
ncbi:MAG TPA: GerAB/ArcD/ProY family transporter [Bacilli bacterium]|nr:GerAB/ArcD/ProY family transporter [Bacilli bacterium]